MRSLWVGSSWQGQLLPIAGRLAAAGAGSGTGTHTAAEAARTGGAERRDRGVEYVFFPSPENPGTRKLQRPRKLRCNLVLFLARRPYALALVASS